MDAVVADEQFEGTTDTLKTVAFGLSTGKGRGGREYVASMKTSMSAQQLKHVIAQQSPRTHH